MHLHHKMQQQSLEGPVKNIFFSYLALATRSVILYAAVGPYCIPRKLYPES